jgi:predicted PurR-regulated permease PerM
MEKGKDHPAVPIKRSPFWWFRWVPTAVVSALTLYGLYVVGSVVLIPVLASVALAYLLNPIVLRLERLGLSRAISAALSIILIGVAIAAFFSYVVPDLWSQSTRAGQKIAESFTPENAARQRRWLARVSPALERVAGEKIEKFLSDPVGFYDENVAEPTPATIDEEGKLRPGRTSSAFVFGTIVSSLDLALVPFFVFYIIIDFPGWRDSAEGLIPPRFREPFSRLFDESGRILQSYVRGQILIGLIMSICYAVGFWALGVPAWAGIALISGMLNAIPYIGTILGILLAGSFTVANGGGIWDLAGVLGIFAAVQTLEAYVLTPRILGGRLNLHPMAVFLALLAGGKLFGFLGIILAIPTIAIGKVFVHFATELYKTSQFYRYGTEDIPSTPPDRVEEKIADAAETVLAEQTEKDKAGDDGDEPGPGGEDDDIKNHK